MIFFIIVQNQTEYLAHIFPQTALGLSEHISLKFTNFLTPTFYIFKSHPNTLAHSALFNKGIFSFTPNTLSISSLSIAVRFDVVPTIINLHSGF